MIIDFQSFTPVASLIGGVMIGVAALLLMLTHGRVMGISGVVGGILGGMFASGDKSAGDKSDVVWRVLFVIGVLVGPFVLMALTGAPVERASVASGFTLPIAGFLVGLGTAIGAGCTSGHGICGLARLSVRSAVAVGMFMTTAIITVYIVRHVV
jgi:uncharacterized membrane protein YedE/YeeE